MKKAFSLEKARFLKLFFEKKRLAALRKFFTGFPFFFPEKSRPL